MIAKKEASYVVSSEQHHDLTQKTIRSFRKIIYNYYRENPRNFPWRETQDPYKILVSEIMLQQTQAERVVEKYKIFIKRFPKVSSIANASLEDILTVWQGLGYNRRALSLKEIAKIVMTKYGNIVPSSEEALVKLPGIGKYTAAAIIAFAYNKPTVIIETNIRTVYIFFFFRRKISVKDTEILPLIEMTYDRKNPREWYYALMDYGVMLKKTHSNLSRKSAYYRRQSPFHGSNRQIRGKILKLLIENPGLSRKEIATQLDLQPEKIAKNLKDLQDEGFLKTARGKYSIL